MKQQYEITLWEPTTTHTHNWCADVYLEGRRIFCGRGGQTAHSALSEANCAIVQHIENGKI